MYSNMVELCSLTMVGARNKYVTDAHNMCSMTSRAAARGQQATTTRSSPKENKHVVRQGKTLR